MNNINKEIESCNSAMGVDKVLWCACVDNQSEGECQEGLVEELLLNSDD
jgi:hypothetical protein